MDGRDRANENATGTPVRGSSSSSSNVNHHVVSVTSVASVVAHQKSVHNPQAATTTIDTSSNAATSTDQPEQQRPPKATATVAIVRAPTATATSLPLCTDRVSFVACGKSLWMFYNHSISDTLFYDHLVDNNQHDVISKKSISMHFLIAL